MNITHIYTNPDLDNEIIRMLCREYKVLNADVTIRGPATEDDIIDVLEGIWNKLIQIFNKLFLIF